MPGGIAWQCVTADGILNKGPTELIYAYLEPSAAGADATFYDGFDADGKKIATIVASVKTSRPLAPKEPVFCDVGLFVDIGTNVASVLVLYKAL
jgi:hypothetical protein